MAPQWEVSGAVPLLETAAGAEPARAGEAEPRPVAQAPGVPQAVVVDGQKEEEPRQAELRRAGVRNRLTGPLVAGQYDQHILSSFLCSLRHVCVVSVNYHYFLC